jgi:type VI secretion system protein ImpL
VSWPGELPGVEIRFEEPGSSRPARVFTGPWALFRWFEFGQPTSAAANTFVLNFRHAGHTARIKIVADSNENPFNGLKLVRNFRCGG